jgi:hypothetical protein
MLGAKGGCNALYIMRVDPLNKGVNHSGGCHSGSVCVARPRRLSNDPRV